MPKISFVKQYPEIEVSSGDNLMKALLKAGRPVASSCQGDGICSKCNIKIVGGLENLSLPTSLEVELKTKNNISKDSRISCQTKILGNILIDTAYW